MDSSITIGYFLEDVAQERFIKALVIRVAEKLEIEQDCIVHEVRNASGGKGRTMTELRIFLNNYAKQSTEQFTLIVVCIDGNCMGYANKRDEILRLKDRCNYPGSLVCAIPDPHIEKWYLADPIACIQAMDLDNHPDCPSYKCEKGRYKQAIMNTLRENGVNSLLGGVEYSELLVEKMDFYKAGQSDSTLKHFLDELEAALGSHRM